MASQERCSESFLASFCGCCRREEREVEICAGFDGANDVCKISRMSKHANQPVSTRGGGGGGGERLFTSLPHRRNGRGGPRVTVRGEEDFLAWPHEPTSSLYTMSTAREGEVCHGRKPLLTKIKTRPAKASSLFKLATASTNPCANIACGNVSCVASKAGAIG